MNANTEFSGRIIEVDYERSTLLIRYEGAPPEVGSSVVPADEGKEASDRLIRAVFLNLLGQVRAFIDAEGEANFWTGPAEALRWTLEGKTPPSHLQHALAKFILQQSAYGVPVSGGDHAA